jgi:hypothetical protein
MPTINIITSVPVERTILYLRLCYVLEIFVTFFRLFVGHINMVLVVAGKWGGVIYIYKAYKISMPFMEDVASNILVPLIQSSEHWSQ